MLEICHSFSHEALDAAYELFVLYRGKSFGFCGGLCVLGGFFLLFLFCFFFSKK